MNEENIDDDALLSGLPSWKDSFQPSKRSSEILTTEKGFGSTQPKPQPSTTTITRDDDARMALRMAALRTLKKRKASSNCTQYPESPTSHEGSSEARSNILPQHPNKTSGDSQEQRPTIPNSKRLIKQSAGKQLEYTDVDAPQNSFETESIQAVEMAHSCGSRQRISYADEYTAKVEPPSGDIDVNSWDNRPLEISVGRRCRMPDNAKKAKPQQHVTPASEQSGSSSSTTHFIQESSWRPLIIDLSDEEDEEIDNDAEVAQEISHPTRDFGKRMQDESKTLQNYGSKKPDNELLRKEEEIERMLAKIQELEQKKNAYTALKSDGSMPQILGKRLTSTDDDRLVMDKAFDCTSLQSSERQTLKVC